MIPILHIHHVAIICSDYERSKQFYQHILGLQLLNEQYREHRRSWKADLGLNGNYIIELFSFPDPPARVSRPEAAGLRHLAFAVNDIQATVLSLQQHVAVEPVRTDETTGKRFTFIADPDGLPIEFYEV